MRDHVYATFPNVAAAQQALVDILRRGVPAGDVKLMLNKRYAAQPQQDAIDHVADESPDAEIVADRSFKVEARPELSESAKQDEARVGGNDPGDVRGDVDNYQAQAVPGRIDTALAEPSSTLGVGVGAYSGFPQAIAPGFGNVMGGATSAFEFLESAQRPQTGEPFGNVRKCLHDEGFTEPIEFEFNDHIAGDDALVRLAVEDTEQAKRLCALLESHGGSVEMHSPKSIKQEEGP